MTIRAGGRSTSACHQPKPRNRLKCLQGVNVTGLAGQAVIKINMELPPEAARRFVRDMEAFHAESDPIKRDEIAARQLHALREHRKPRDPKLRLSEVKELFERMRDFMEEGQKRPPPRS